MHSVYPTPGDRARSRMWMRLSLLPTLVLSAMPISGQTIPSGGVSLVDVADVAVNGSFYSNAVGSGTVAVRTIVPVTGQSFTQAAAIDVQNPTGEFWSSAVSAQSNRATSDGDVVLLRFFLRAIESQDETGSVFCQVYVEGPGPDYVKSVSQNVSAGPEWMEYFLPFEVDGNYASGQLGVKFGFGASARPQVLELGGVEAIWYGKSRTLAEMPRTSINYDGRAADAAWRAAAAQRIELYRKANYEVRVVNQDGLPVSRVKVRARLRRHAFPFGTAFPAARVVDQSSTDNQTFRTRLVELFNAGGPENDLKWPPWAGDWGADYNQQQTLAALEWLKTQDFELRGHVLVWPSTRNLPNSITSLPSADPSIPQRVLDHISEIVPATRDYLDEWDVLNEPYDNHDLMDWFGDEIMVEWFEEARIHHPTARLYINDYGIISGSGLNETKQQFYENLIRYLLDEGAPLGGVGFQGHFDGSPTGIPRVWSILERYANALPDEVGFKITEFDVDTDDEQLQADYTRDFLTICFSHPRMLGFQFWGFWEGAHWRPRAAMYRQSWEEKPNGAAYRDLVFNQWWTDDVRQTMPDGRVRGRGFRGDYDLEVEIDGEIFSGEMTLDADGTSATVVVDKSLPGTPQVTIQPLGATVLPGEEVRLYAEGAGVPEPQITWFKNGVALDAHDPEFVIAAAQASDEGLYRAEFTNAEGTAVTRQVRIGVRTLEQRDEKLINISTRGQVGAGAGVMIVGFVLDGDKDVLLRGVGPRLGALGVLGALADPRLQIYRFGESTPFAQNDDWDPALAPVMQQVYAFPLTNDTKSAALRLQLEAGLYTAHLSGVGGTQGVGLVEAYDVETAEALKLVNISTRGEVGGGEGVLIAGFVVHGDVPQKVLIRGVGPRLTSLGVPGALADPVLTLFGQAANVSYMIAFNDDWSVGNDPASISAAAASVFAFSLPAFSRDASLLVSLEPGIYTVHLAGANDTTGIGLIEVYAVP